MVGPTRIGHSKCAFVQVSMGFRRKTRIVAKVPSGTSCGRGAGGRGGSTRRSFMALIPIVGVAAWKAGRLDAEPVSSKYAPLRDCLGSRKRARLRLRPPRYKTRPAALGSLRLAVQDVALSRRKQGFESPRERQ